jgi:hypothetical protein
MVFCAGGRGETPKGIARFWVVGSAGKVHINDDNDGNDNQDLNESKTFQLFALFLLCFHALIIQQKRDLIKKAVDNKKTGKEVCL